MSKRIAVIAGIVCIFLGIGILVHCLGGGEGGAAGITPTRDPNRPAPVVDVSRQVLYSKDGVTIMALGTECDEYGTTNVRLECTNKTSRNLYILVPVTAYNRIMSDSYSYNIHKVMNVAAKGKAECTIRMDRSDIENLEVQFLAYYDNYDGEQAFDTGTVRISTTNDNKNSGYMRLTKRIYSKNGISIDVVCLQDEKPLEFLITNETDACLNFTFDKFVINGVAIECLDNGLFNESVLSGCQPLRCIYEDRFPDNYDYASMKTIRFSFRAWSEGFGPQKKYEDTIEFTVE